MTHFVSEHDSMTNVNVGRRYSLRNAGVISHCWVIAESADNGGWVGVIG